MEQSIFGMSIWKNHRQPFHSLSIPSPSRNMCIVIGPIKYLDHLLLAITWILFAPCIFALMVTSALKFIWVASSWLHKHLFASKHGPQTTHGESDRKQKRRESRRWNLHSNWIESDLCAHLWNTYNYHRISRVIYSTFSTDLAFIAPLIRLCHTNNFFPGHFNATLTWKCYFQSIRCLLGL